MKPTKQRQSATETVLQCPQWTLRSLSHGLIKRLIRKAAKIEESGNKASTQPPQPLPPRPFSHAKKSPPNRSSSIGFATIDPKRTPKGIATTRTTGNRHAETRLLNPGGQSCHKNAPTRSTSGTVKILEIKNIALFSISGAMISPAINPNTTLGRLAIISITGLIRDFEGADIN